MNCLPDQCLTHSGTWQREKMNYFNLTAHTKYILLLILNIHRFVGGLHSEHVNSWILGKKQLPKIDKS